MKKPHKARRKVSPAQEMVIATFRTLLSACVQRYGLRNSLVLTPSALSAAGNGMLSVTDRPDGSIVLTIKPNKERLT